MNQGGSHNQRTSLEIAAQIMVVGIAAAVVVGLATSVYHGLAAHNIPFSFDFLPQVSGLHLTEGLTLDWSNGLRLAPFTSSDSNLQALLLGLYTTLKVAIVGIVLSTLLGLLVGAGRVSTNWMLNRLCLYFEIGREWCRERVCKYV